MKDCVFCKIVKGEIPCYKIYEDEQFLAFFDIAPVCEGHTLVIPKKHFHWIWDLPEQSQTELDFQKYLSVVHKIAKNYVKVQKNDFVSIITWGLDVPHAHIHILPQPGCLGLNWKRDKLTEEKATKLLVKLTMTR